MNLSGMGGGEADKNKTLGPEQQSCFWCLADLTTHLDLAQKEKGRGKRSSRAGDILKGDLSVLSAPSEDGLELWGLDKDVCSTDVCSASYKVSSVNISDHVTKLAVRVSPKADPL